MRAIFFLVLLILPGMAQARDFIRIAGSSTVFPFVSAAAEQFGRSTDFRTPIVESTGTGGGFKIFCEGLGDQSADMSNASRAIKDSEVDACRKNGVTEITELKIGYDGIVIANASASPAYAFSKRDLFLAMAREVPQGGKLVENPYTRWRQINPKLPDVAIAIYGPPPVEGTRDALVELVMDEGCKLFPEYVALDEASKKQKCEAMREDGRFVELLGGNIMVQKLVNNPDAFAIFGYNFLSANAAVVKANSVDGVMPSFASIVSGDYKVARSLYVYVKDQQADAVPGLREFARFIAADAATGPDGYLIMRGLLPLPAEEHAAVKKKAAGI